MKAEAGTDTDPPSRTTWRLVWVAFWVAASFSGLCILTALILFYGSPTWHPGIFRFQQHWKHTHGRFAPRPDDEVIVKKDESGYVIAIENKTQQLLWLFDRDNQGRLLSETDPVGRRMLVEWDSDGWIIGIRYE